MRTTSAIPAPSGYAVPVAQDAPEARLAFLRKVYALLTGSVVIWGATALVVASNVELASRMLGLFGGFLGLLLFMLLAFGLLKVTANRFPLNVIGLGLFAVLEGLITGPVILGVLAQNQGTIAPDGSLVVTAGTLAAGRTLLLQAFGLTGAVFGGLTAYALTTKRDFSFLRGALWAGFFVLFGIGILAMFGIGEDFVMGWGWSAAWVLLFCGFILYDTQNVMRRYPANMAAAAAATLLIDIVILFMHILRLLGNRR